MSQGLRVWNASGVLQLDITNRITRIHGTYSYSIAAGSNTTISVPGISTDGTWIAYAPFVACLISAGSVQITNNSRETVSGSLTVMRA